MNNTIHAKRYAALSAMCSLATAFGMIACEPGIAQWFLAGASFLVTFMTTIAVVPYHEDGSK